MNQGIYTLLAALLLGIVTLHTLYKNEENKRSFHFIEQTWNKKYSLFENLISKIYQVSDCYYSVFSIHKIMFKQSSFVGWQELIAQVFIIQRVHELPISPKEFQKLVSMKKNEIDSNLEFLKGIKNLLMFYYENKAYKISDEFHEIVSKLNLIIFDVEIVENTQSIMEHMLKTGAISRRGKEVDEGVFVKEIQGRMKHVVGKMRTELIETLEVDLKKLPEKLKLN